MKKRFIVLLLSTLFVLFAPSQVLAGSPVWSPDEEFSPNPTENVPPTGLVPTTSIAPAPELVASADTATATTSAAQLSALIDKVSNGQSGVAAGIYAPGVFALKVLNQPADNPAYVSSVLGTATRFGLASQNGTIGLLAHNYLSGKRFFDLTVGQEIDVVNGDGVVVPYVVTQTRHFQALEPDSPYSSFVDLDNGGTLLSSTDLFNQMYGSGGRLVMQTCIKADGNSSWGRLFVIAQPK